MPPSTRAHFRALLGLLVLVLAGPAAAAGGAQDRVDGVVRVSANARWDMHVRLPVRLTIGYLSADVASDSRARWAGIDIREPDGTPIAASFVAVGQSLGEDWHTIAMSTGTDSNGNVYLDPGRYVVRLLSDRPSQLWVQGWLWRGISLSRPRPIHADGRTAKLTPGVVPITQHRFPALPTGRDRRALIAATHIYESALASSVDMCVVKSSSGCPLEPGPSHALWVAPHPPSWGLPGPGGGTIWQYVDGEQLPADSGDAVFTLTGAGPALQLATFALTYE